MINNKFTLIELIITIVTLSILAAIIIPNVKGVLKDGEVASYNANAKAIELAVDMYHELEGKLPTEDGLGVSKFEDSKKIVLDDLKKSNLLKGKASEEKVEYFLDEGGSVYWDWINPKHDGSNLIPLEVTQTASLTNWETVIEINPKQNEVGVKPIKYVLEDGTVFNKNRISFKVNEEKVYSVTVFYKNGVSEVLNIEASLGNPFIYSNHNGLITITGYRGVNKDITIPLNIDGLPVTAIANYAFYPKEESYTLGKSNVRINSLILPEGLKTIGSYAFAKNNLTYLIVPDTITTVGEYAFASNRIEAVVGGNSVKKIPKFVFYDNQIKSIDIPLSVTHIEEYAFAKNNLTYLIVPDTITTVGEYAFAFNKIEEVIGGHSVKIVPKFVFYDNQLKSIDIPPSVTHIEEYAFAKNKIEVITGAQYLESIGKYAFFDNSIEALYSPSFLRYVGEYAFFKNNLNDLRIDHSISIENMAFGENPNLLEIYDYSNFFNESNKGNYFTSNPTIIN